MAVTNSPYGNTGLPAAALGAIGGLANTASSNGPGNTPVGDGSDGTDGWGILGNLLTTGATGYANNRNNQNYRSDINNMMSIGTGGVTNDDRAGARGLVRGVYDGSIDPSTMLDRVPGLRALSDRGAADIGRQMSAHGDADPQSSARMREFINFNNELTSKAYGSEMDRAMKVGGYNIDPSAMAGQGMRAIGDIYGNNRQDLSALAALAGRGTGASGAAGGLANLGSSALRQIASGTGPMSSLARGLLGWGSYDNANNGEATYDPFSDPTATAGNNLYNESYNLDMNPEGLPSYFDPSINWGDLYG